MPISEPWARVKNPPPIPDPLTASMVLSFSSEQLARLLQGNLTPRSESPEDRTRWAGLWRLLADDDELADRAFDVLEQMLDTTSDALDDADLPEAARRRAVSFRGRCEDAWRRLEVDDSNTVALAWAGERAMKFNSEARKVIATLVGAIAKHRAARTETDTFDKVDSTLWRSLRQVGLDPRDSD